MKKKSEKSRGDKLLTLSEEINRKNTILMQGYLKIGKVLIIGPDNPEIRAIIADTMKQISELNPSTPMRKLRHSIPNEVYYLLIGLVLLFLGWWAGLLTAQHYFHQ